MVAFLYMFILLFYSPSPGASLRPDETRIDRVREIIDRVYSDSFETAYRLAEAINDTLPGRPIYNLIVASILHAEMTDLEDYSRKKEFFTRLDSSKKFFEGWTRKNPEDPWGFYFLGTVHAYKSMLHAQQKSWLKTLIEGLKARGKYTRALEIDPALYDAYAGLGSYHFWSSVILRKYLPFIDDNTERGLAELRLAADSSYFSSRPAATGLAWALINRKRFPEASKIALELYKESSGGRISLWILGSVYWRWGGLNKAANYYGELIESLDRLENQNYYGLVFCRYRRGFCLYQLRRYEDAEKEFKTIISYNVSKEVRERHKKTLEKTREYLEKIESQPKREDRKSLSRFNSRN